MELELLVKEIQIKTLVSGDKSARIVFETIDPKDIPAVATLSDKMVVRVKIDTNARKKDKR